MGHYDDCYASDDFSKMKQKSKNQYIKVFEKEMDECGSVHRYYDDVEGWILKEWAEIKNYEIKDGYKGITVTEDNLLRKAKQCIKEKNKRGIK